MKIIGSNHGVVIITLPIDDVKPPQGIISQQLVDILTTKYGLTFNGQQRQLTAVVGGLLLPTTISFANGIAEIDGQTIPIFRMDIGIESNQIHLVSSTTNDAEKIWSDIALTLEQTCGFRNLQQLSTRHYISNITVQFERNIDEKVQILSQIQSIISPLFKQGLNIDEKINLVRLTFGCDPLQIPQGKALFLGEFILERRAGHPYSENRFFSSAPAQTTEHIKVLEEIGAFFEGKN